MDGSSAIAVWMGWPGRSSIAELHARVIALFVVVAGAAVGQVVMRLVTGR